MFHRSSYLKVNTTLEANVIVQNIIILENLTLNYLTSKTSLLLYNAFCEELETDSFLMLN